MKTKKTPDKLVSVTARLPEPLIKHAKNAAVLVGVPFQTLIADALAEYLPGDPENNPKVFYERLQELAVRRVAQAKKEAKA